MFNRFADKAQSVQKNCVDCSICVKKCRFLSEQGSPRSLAELFLKEPDSEIAFQCSLCSLCTAVCPKDVDPASLLMAQRCQVVNHDQGHYGQHQPLLAYEKRGSSRLFSWYGLPEGCDTIFFPGCALPGSRPQRVLDVVDQLQKEIPKLGVVLDCCTKPSHDLGRQDYFQTMFFGLQNILKKKGIKKVLVACPNCFRMFKEYGDQEVQTIYELLKAPSRSTCQQELTLHDPCAVRFDTHVHAAVRNLIEDAGFTVQEMKHHGTKTLCCGEGGAVGYLNKELAQSWTELRRQEAGEQKVITYCAGCSHYLGKRMDTCHLLDLLFEPKKTMARSVKVAPSPMTYWHRYRLKKKLAQVLAPQTALCREDMEG
ncbi:MAG: (Fe-S)-binding protein [Thermodesulfobacteriota bacterium]